jgi:anti-sigma-K factor RskA
MSGQRFPHEELEGLIAADALYGLSELERRRMLEEMERHGPDCEECRRLFAEYTEVAASLALSVPPSAMSKGPEDRLLEAIGSERPSGAGRSQVRRVRRWIAAAAVAAAIAVHGGTAGYLIAPRGPSADSRLIAFVSQQGTRVVAFPGKDNQQLAVAFRPGEQQSWVFGTNLPSLPDGKVYELWYQPAADAAVQPAGTFVPKDGTVVAPTSVGDTVVALAVSVEPAGGSQQPTTTPIYLIGV